MIVIDEAIKKELTQTPRIGKHAKERAEERYGMTPFDFGYYVGKNHRKFRYVSLTYGYNSELGRMFVYDGKTFILHLTENEIITTYECDMKKSTKTSERYAARIKRKADAIFNAEIKKIESAEARALRKLEMFRAEIEMELGELRQTFAKARSIAKKIALRARLSALELRLQDIPSEEAAVKVEKMRKLQALTSTLKNESEAFL